MAVLYFHLFLLSYFFLFLFYQGIFPEVYPLVEYVSVQPGCLAVTFIYCCVCVPARLMNIMYKEEWLNIC